MFLLAFFHFLDEFFVTLDLVVQVIDLLLFILLILKIVHLLQGPFYLTKFFSTNCFSFFVKCRLLIDLFLNNFLQILKTRFLFLDHYLTFVVQHLLMVQITQNKEQVDRKKEKNQTYDDHSYLVLDNRILAGITVGVGKRHHQDRNLEIDKLIEDLDLVEFWLDERFVTDEV